MRQLFNLLADCYWAAQERKLEKKVDRLIADAVNGIPQDEGFKLSDVSYSFDLGRAFDPVHRTYIVRISCASKELESRMKESIPENTRIMLSSIFQNDIPCYATYRDPVQKYYLSF